MAFKIKDGLVVGSTLVFDENGILQTTPPTADKLATARTISVSGDATGSATFDGSANVDIAVTISGLGGGTFTGDFVGDVFAADGTSKILESGTNGSDAIFTGSLTALAGQTVDVSAATFTLADNQISGDKVEGGTIDTITVNNLTSNNVDINGGAIDGVALGATTPATELNVDNVKIDGVTVSTTGVDEDLVLAPTGNVSVSNKKIVNVAAPTAPTDAANKAYVDAVAEGLTIKPAVKVATTGDLGATYANGTAGVGATLTIPAAATLDIDGVTAWSVYDGVLVKDQTNAFENGRYYVSTVGDAGTDWVLTRCGYCDEATEIPSMFVFVQEGTTNNSTGWVATVDTLPMTVGTDAVVFQQFSGAGSYTAGTGLALNGTEFSLSHLGLEALADPGADRVFFWDASAAAAKYLEIGDNLALTDTTLTGNQPVFKTVAVAGKADVVANDKADTLTLVAGSGISIETDNAAQSITISGGLEAGSATVSLASAEVIDTVALADARSIKYTVQVTQGTNYQTSEYLVIHDGTTAQGTEFAVLETNGSLGELSVAVNGANLEVKFTLATAGSATVSFKKSAL